MSKYLIEVNKIKKNYLHKNGSIKVLNNISFNIKSGDLVALVGASGSGKSSLLHLLALIDEPTSGKIFFNGKNKKKFNEKKKNDIRQRNISIIFQNNNLLNDFTAVENVVMPLIIRGDDYKTSYKKAVNILKTVNLESRSNHYPNEMSGGEQQRVAIARSLIAETSLILADEPTGNLDFITSKNIFSYLLKLKKLNKAIIFATHNRELANKADYKLSISKGNIKRVNARGKKRI